MCREIIQAVTSRPVRQRAGSPGPFARSWEAPLGSQSRPGAPDVDCEAATFYADLWLAIRLGKLNRAGDHVYQVHGTPDQICQGRPNVAGELEWRILGIY